VNLFYQPDLPNGTHHLDEEESRHAIKVFRLNTGDLIEITDGKGTLYTCRITKADAKKCAFEVTQQVTKPAKPYSIHIAIAPTKNADRIEWFVEKAVEFGIDEISFLLCNKSERKTINTERIEKLTISALKQSGQLFLPKVHPIQVLENFMSEKADQKFIAYVDKNNVDLLKSIAIKGQKYLVLIGPEGDFSREELEMAQKNNFQKISLGPNRLRTETAGLAACHILNLLNQ
jgi:16S rRNA (uracil1498-N3)-methyltransferase